MLGLRLFRRVAEEVRIRATGWKAPFQRQLEQKDSRSGPRVVREWLGGLSRSEVGVRAGSWWRGILSRVSSFVSRSKGVSPRPRMTIAPFPPPALPGSGSKGRQRLSHPLSRVSPSSPLCSDGSRLYLRPN